MQSRKLIAVIILLLSVKVQAQNNIRAYEAKDSVGKRVSVMARVINVTENAKTKVVRIGLNDWDSKDAVLTLIIHLKKTAKPNKAFFDGLQGQTVQFEGRVERLNGKIIINSTDYKSKISRVIFIDCHLPLVSS